MAPHTTMTLEEPLTSHAILLVRGAQNKGWSYILPETFLIVGMTPEAPLCRSRRRTSGAGEASHRELVPSWLDFAYKGFGNLLLEPVLW